MTRIKICGITRVKDAELALSLGAWAIGLIFHEPSPRSVDPAMGEDIGHSLHRRAEVVGVFANETLDTVAYIADRCGLSIIQLHGDEGPVFCTEVARRTGAKVIKAGRVKGPESLQALRAFRTDFRMADAHAEDVLGGTGRTFDWELLSGYSQDVPLVLSGGLTSENVAAGIEQVRPFAVDTASGTEASPGVKDPAKLEAFFVAVASTAPPAPEPELFEPTGEPSA